LIRPSSPGDDIAAQLRHVLSTLVGASPVGCGPSRCISTNLQAAIGYVQADRITKALVLVGELNQATGRLGPRCIMRATVSECVRYAIVADDPPTIRHLVWSRRQPVGLFRIFVRACQAELFKPQGVGRRERVELLVTVRVGEPNVDDAAAVIVLVSKKAKPIMDADPPMMGSVRGVLPLACAADSSMQDGAGRPQVLVQLCAHVVEALQ